jgi:hypothetical protein
MSPGKHGPNRLQGYIATHQTIMNQLLQGGFVASEDLLLEPDGEGGYFIDRLGER